MSSATYPITRAVLMTRVNQRANTSGYVDQTSELPGLIDTSLGKLHNLLAGELYEDYYQKRYQIQLVANQSIYPLPPNFMKIRALFYLNPVPGQNPLQGQRWPMRRMDPTEETNSTINSSYPNQTYGYNIEDQSLVVYPVPGGTGPFNQLLMYYIPTYVPAQNNNSPIELAVAFGWDEWVVNDVTIAIRLKAMMPVEELIKERDSYVENLRIQAKNRNAVEPPKVRNTGWRYGNSFPTWGQFSFTS